MGCLSCFYDDSNPDDPRNARKKGKGSPPLSDSSSFMSGSSRGSGGSVGSGGSRGSFVSGSSFVSSPRSGGSRSPGAPSFVSSAPPSPPPAKRSNSDPVGAQPQGVNINVGGTNVGNAGAPPAQAPVPQQNTQMMPYAPLPGQMPMMPPAMMPNPYAMPGYGLPAPYGMPYGMPPPPPPQQQQQRTILAQNGNFMIT